MGAIALFQSRAGTDSADVVRRMAAAAPHRGDQVDVITHSSGALAAINSADGPADAQLAQVAGVAVAFVGSLDNAEELQRDMESRTSAAPESAESTASFLARAYRVHGDSLPARMRGVFAVAITDAAKVACFRDHIGYRPLFYRRDGEGLYVASEAKQVVAGAAISRQPDLEAVEAIFYRTITDETPSALAGVLRLPKATLLLSDADGLHLAGYWDPASLLETGPLGDDELAARFAQLMDQAVSRAMSGDDGISLSGGIDSPGVAAFAAPRHQEQYGKPLQAMSVVYPRFPSVDESGYVTRLSEYLRIPLHTYEQSANSLADIRRWTALADSPFPGASLAQYEEDYRRARSLGIRTLLSGEHAEFVFAFHWNALDHYLTHRRLRAVRWLLAQRRRQLHETWAHQLRLVIRALTPDQLLRARRLLGGGRPPTVPRWLDAKRASEEEPVRVSERWRRGQLLGFIGPGIALEAEEVCQDICGIRARRPWTDIDLWELFLRLPAEQKFPDIQSKALVRKLLRGRLPDEILDRRDKTVFDEAALSEIDYVTLRSLLESPTHHLPGVDYEALADLLEREQLTPVDYVWARELAGVHAFLSQW